MIHMGSNHKIYTLFMITWKKAEKKCAKVNINLQGHGKLFKIYCWEGKRLLNSIILGFCFLVKRIK